MKQVEFASRLQAVVRRPLLQVVMLGGWLLVLLLALWQVQSVDGLMCGVPR